MVKLPDLPPPPKQSRKPGVALSPLGIFFIIILFLGLAGILGWVLLQEISGEPILSGPDILPVITETAIPATVTLPILPTITEANMGSEPTQTPFVMVVTATPNPELPVLNTKSLTGMVIMAKSDFGYTHLFAYHPETLPLARLTSGEWDDMHPAASPDGKQIAFTSHRGGQWDLYILDLPSGKTSQVTNDLAFDGHPSWNPEGTWLAFEKYVDDNLEIFIQPIDQSIPPIRVTVNSMADYAAVWNPDGATLAFTSNQGGINDIWLADIERIGQSDYLVNITSNPDTGQAIPAWSPDGKQLSWIESVGGYPSVFIGTPFESELNAQYIGAGNSAVWSPDGSIMFTVLASPTQQLLSFYNVTDNSYLFPPIRPGGQLKGISWSPQGLPSLIPEELKNAASANPQASWALQLTPNAGSIHGKQYTLNIPGVIAPHPALNALVIEPFVALRERTLIETGWDVLSDLENAFVPLTNTLEPGYDIDWLYTGRAFALNRNLIRLDWMHIVREDFGNDTYWRVYLKARYQDGSQGQPLARIPWDLSARYTGNTSSYEEGGMQYNDIPSGYWIDFTALAIEYGWERQSALSNWQSYYQGAHFNVFAVTNGLDWETAMLQLYPPEIFEIP